MPFSVDIQKLKMPTQPKDPRATPKPFKHSHLISKPYEAEKTKKSGGFESLLNKKPTNKTLNPTPTSFSYSFMKQTLGELGPKTTNQSPNRSLCSSLFLLLFNSHHALSLFLSCSLSDFIIIIYAFFLIIYLFL